MKNEHLWLIWIPLIVLVIMLFPKSCGFKNPSKDVNYHCTGFNTPYLSQIEKSDNPQKWCSGICFSSSIKKGSSQVNQTQDSDIDLPFSGVTDSFGKIIPIMFLILLVVGLIRWISNISDRFKKK